MPIWKKSCTKQLTKINPTYQVRLSSAELADGKLDKEPSRIIVTDITTIDKARLGRRIGRLTPECPYRAAGQSAGACPEEGKA